MGPSYHVREDWPVTQHTGSRAIVVGGSIGGLTTALLLRRLGFTVDVYERNPEQLDNRGGGIVLQPITMKWFDGHSARRIDELSTSSTRLRYLGPDNEIVHESPAEWRYTSWGTVYGALLADFGRERYHLGEHCAGFSQDDEKVEVPADELDPGWIEDTVMEVADGILGQGFEPTPSYAACSWCDYRIACPAAET